ncbi:MAG TPA: TM2 domain-containing protein [Bacteroidia bacterium]|nr:TM2 domain-containing protein [Bacteroidia bacterium]
MKKAIVLSLVMGLLSINSFAGASQYKLDNSSVDALFAQSVNVTSTMMTGTADLSFASFAIPTSSSNAMVGDKTPVVAFLLAFFLGFLGIHRFYLGTKTMTGVGYILTCGGLGIVAFVDWILLLIGTINDDIDKYVDNPKFFMW